jgi:hypothetical protein
MRRTRRNMLNELRELLSVDSGPEGRRVFYESPGLGGSIFRREIII